MMPSWCCLFALSGIWTVCPCFLSKSDSGAEEGFAEDMPHSFPLGFDSPGTWGPRAPRERQDVRTAPPNSRRFIIACSFSDVAGTFRLSLTAGRSAVGSFRARAHLIVSTPVAAHPGPVPRACTPLGGISSRPYPLVAHELQQPTDAEWGGTLVVVVHGQLARIIHEAQERESGETEK